MIPSAGPAGEMLDVAYALGGGPLPRDHAHALRAQLRAALSWLDDEPRAGIHPLHRTTASGDQLLLGARSRLVLRVPRARLPDCAALQGRRLALPAPLHLGEAQARELLPYRTLYSALVTLDDPATADEPAFMDALRAAVDTLDLACQIIVGKAGERRDAGDAALRGYSVMLHGLTPAQSLQMQAQGLGAARLLGCGLFIPHKSVDPVGA